MSSLDEEDRPGHSKADLNGLQKIPEKKGKSGCSRKSRALAFKISCIAAILVAAGVSIPTAWILTQKRTNTTFTSTIAAISTNSISTTIILSSVNLNTTPTMIILDITSMAGNFNLTNTTTMIPPNLLINPGAETGTLSPWIIGGSGTPTVDDGSENSGKKPYSGTKQFFGGYSSSGTSTDLTQNILLLNGTQEYTAAQLDSGNLHAYISFYEQSLSQTFATDKGGIILVFRTLDNTLISTVATPLFSCWTNWCEQSFFYSLPIGTRRIDYIMTFERKRGRDIDSYFDDNSLKVY